MLVPTDQLKICHLRLGSGGAPLIGGVAPAGYVVSSGTVPCVGMLT